MSKNLPIRPRSIVPNQAGRFLLVVSEFNSEFTQPMMKQASDTIHGLVPQSIVESVLVPGAYEIPLAVKLGANTHRYAAIIALGVILRGETAHADLVGRAVTDALLRLSLEYTVPVLHEVLLLDTEEQARARCSEGELNRGAEAARAAIEMVKIVAAFAAPSR